MLEPYTHQLAELEAEISRETQLLETDEAHLKQLKANAKAEEKVRAEQAKNVCIDIISLSAYLISGVWRTPADSHP
jgi:hypothetical protein